MVGFFIFFEKSFGANEINTIFAPSLRGRAEVARRAHNPKVSGSNPLLATKERISAGKETRKSRRNSAFFISVSLSREKAAQPLLDSHAQSRFCKHIR